MDKEFAETFKEEIEVVEGWKKGKYTIKDENGKILGTYSSGGKAKKVMDDLMQKGDYPELTVSMVEEVEVAEKFAGWIAIYGGKQLEIKKSEADGIWPAKQLAIKHFKVPKSKLGLLAIAPAHEEVEKQTKLKEKIMDLEDTVKQIIGETNKNDKSDDGDGLDAVQPKAVKKKFKDRKDKDIDNDGDVDSSDKFLHKKRKAISKAISKEQKTFSKMFTHVKSLIQGK
jgi:hypothetical protein